MKNTLKLLLVLFILFLTILIFSPFLLKKELKATFTKEINRNINADFFMEDISLSFLSKFPNASIKLKNTLITNREPFNGDTLVFIDEVSLKTTIWNLLSKELILDSFSISNGTINLKSNLASISNYDIFSASEAAANNVSENSDFNSKISLQIKKYSFNNIQFNYLDEKNQLSMVVHNFNHRGTGNFSTENIILTTNSSIDALTVSSGNLKYLDAVQAQWNAKININLQSKKIELMENSAALNDLNIMFYGFVQPLESGIEMDLKFDSKASEFKNLLSLVPSVYATNFNALKTKGTLTFNGSATGLYSKESIPKFDVSLLAREAFIQYPNLPKAITDIAIDTQIINTTGQLDDTEIAIRAFNFKIDQDDFNGSGLLSHLSSDPHIKVNLDGVINLANLTQAYPLKLNERIAGILDFKLQSEFTKKAIEEEAYARIKNSGFVSIEKLNLQTELLPFPVKLETAQLEITPETFTLKKIIVKIGSSDLKATGKLSNVPGFLFADKTLTGNFSIESNQFNILDFIPQEESKPQIATLNKSAHDSIITSRLSIPKNINITTDLTSKTINYNNILLKNIKSRIRVNDQKVIFEHTTAALLDGRISFTGDINTSSPPNTFNCSMSLKQLDIAESFSSLELFSSIAPFAKAIHGDMSTELKLKGSLDSSFFPDTQSLSGAGLSTLEVSEIDPKKSDALYELQREFKFIDFHKLDMKKVKAHMEFNNSKVYFKPFTIASYDRIPIQMQGYHSFNHTMDYTITTEIPVKKRYNYYLVCQRPR